MLIKYRYRYMTSEFICCFCSRWTNPICFIHVLGHENFASWLYQRMFMSLQCVMALESNVIFRGFSRSYLLPLPVQISSVLSSACKSEKSTCLKQNEAAIATDIYLQIITTVQGNLIKLGNGHKTNETIIKKQNYLHHSTFCYSSQFCFLKSSP